MYGNGSRDDYRFLFGSDMYGVHICFAYRCRQIECYTFFVSPDIFNKFGIIDKRVTVVLFLLDGFVPVDLFRIYIVVSVPFQQKIDYPIFITGIRISSSHFSSESGKYIFITCCNIKIGTGEISFILVVRFENSSRISGKGACPQFAETIIGFINFAIGFSIRIITSFIINEFISGINIE